ncbi:MAG: L,D-transpeptidase family protein [Mariprofundaceae bacterium]
MLLALSLCLPLTAYAAGDEARSAANAVGEPITVASLSPDVLPEPAMAPVAVVANHPGQRWQRVFEALKAGDSDVVQELSNEDRAILRAALALKSNQPAQALELLNDTGVNDPLAALLLAEAHRREAVQAVQQAGDYAHGIAKQEQMLASADLSVGLGEADARLNAFMDKLDAVNGLPLDILLPGPGIANVFMVDKARSRLFVFAMGEDGKLTRVADEYVVTGSARGDKTSEGDGRTPNGVYRFVQKLQGKALEARYGPVAFPIDYPNELDQLHNKKGHGIWMHGYPTDVQRRPPQDTRGCFSLPNPRLMAMAEQVQLGKSWVIVGRDFRFGQDEQRQALQQSVRDALTAWKQDWTSLDSDAYLSHYHKRFRSGKRDLAAWKRYKKRVNASKTFINVEFENLSLIHDPNRWPEGEVVVAEFDQIYRSSNYADQGRKRLYLARSADDAPWQILLEETVQQ